jgi:hypothetical protein
MSRLSLDEVRRRWSRDTNPHAARIRCYADEVIELDGASSYRSSAVRSLMAACGAERSEQMRPALHSRGITTGRVIGGAII